MDLEGSKLTEILCLRQNVQTIWQGYFSRQNLADNGPYFYTTRPRKAWQPKHIVIELSRAPPMQQLLPSRHTLLKVASHTPRLIYLLQLHVSG